MTTVYYRVIFTPDVVDWVPPLGVMGGVMGEVSRGQLAVYRMPQDTEQDFLSALKSLTTVVEFEQMEKGKTQ